MIASLRKFLIGQRRLFVFLALFQQALDLTQTFSHRDAFGADIRAPPHALATPDPLIIIKLGQPVLGSRIA
jgi:hypothetical protein